MEIFHKANTLVSEKYTEILLYEYLKNTSYLKQAFLYLTKEESFTMWKDGITKEIDFKRIVIVILKWLSLFFSQCYFYGVNIYFNVFPLVLRECSEIYKMNLIFIFHEYLAKFDGSSYYKMAGIIVTKLMKIAFVALRHAIFMLMVKILLKI